MKRLIALTILSYFCITSMSWAACIQGNCNNGKGTYTWPSGNKYVGEFKNGNLNGQGTKTWATGGKYVGEWKNGDQHGKGTEIWPNNGGKYVGEYKDGKRHGEGTFTYADGDKYVGEYKDNVKHGQGTYTFSDGDKWVGEFKNDMLNGYGIQYNADGSIYREGIFKDDEFLYEEKRGESTSSSSGNSELDSHKEFCKEIGFTPGTEKFGDCVMKLMEKD